MVGHVSGPFVVGSFEEGALNGVSLSLVRADFSVEVLVRHVEFGCTFGQVAAKFPDFAHDFVVVVLSGFLVQGFLGDVDVGFEFLALVPASLDAPDVSPVSGRRFVNTEQVVGG